MRVYVVLLLLLGITACASACTLQPPCGNRSGTAAFLNATNNCCVTCPAGSWCNGTHATPCVLLETYGRAIAQPMCLNVTRCNATQFMVSEATLRANRVCRDALVCNATTEYERVQPTATTDRVCTVLRVCNVSSEFQAEAPTATTDRVCRQITRCNLLSEQIVAPATPTSDTVCDCRPNFVRTSAGSPCVSCQNFVSDCNTCELRAGAANGSQVACTECLMAMQPVVRPDGLRCVRCATENCVECNERDTCIECKAGFRLQEGGATRCVCNISGCASCGTDGACAACTAGFRLVRSACVCDRPYCAQCGEDGRCAACVDGYKLQDGECVCDVHGCALCDEAGGTCAMCAFGFRRTASGMCECALVGCDTCAFDRDAVGFGVECTRCSGVLRLDTNGECYCMLDHCEQCSYDGFACLRCRPPFAEKSGRCFCGIKGCAECNSTGCARCAGALQARGQSECVCGLARCEQCTEDGARCVDCRPPFVALDGRCSCGIADCMECNSTGCERCASGYNLTARGSCMNGAENQEAVETKSQSGSATTWIGIAAGALAVCGVVVAVCAVHRHRKIAAAARNRAFSHSPPTLGSFFHGGAPALPARNAARPFLPPGEYVLPTKESPIYATVTEADICAIKTLPRGTIVPEAEGEQPTYDLASASEPADNSGACDSSGELAEAVYDVGTADGYADVEDVYDERTIAAEPSGYLTVLPTV